MDAIAQTSVILKKLFFFFCSCLGPKPHPDPTPSHFPQSTVVGGMAGGMSWDGSQDGIKGNCVHVKDSITPSVELCHSWNQWILIP